VLNGVTVCTVGSEPWRASLSNRILTAKHRCAALFVSTVSPARSLCAGCRPPRETLTPTRTWTRPPVSRVEWVRQGHPPSSMIPPRPPLSVGNEGEEPTAGTSKRISMTFKLFRNHRPSRRRAGGGRRRRDRERDPGIPAVGTAHVIFPAMHRLFIARMKFSEATAVATPL
jgi:hypothetical protein